MLGPSDRLTTRPENQHREVLSMTVQSPPPSYPPPAPKKGMGPLAWIGIGCGVILVIGVIAMFAVGFFVKRQVDKFEDNPAMAAATLAVKLNPDLELVSSDAEKNKIGRA